MRDVSAVGGMSGGGTGVNRDSKTATFHTMNRIHIHRSQLLLGALLSVVAVTTACASPTRLQRRIADLDTDGDGALSLEEFKESRIAKRSDNPEELFRQVDADGDGRLTFQEIKDYYRR